MSDLAASVLRPFSRWNLEPHHDEPAHGYFARLVAEEQCSSVIRYATQIGLRGRNPSPIELLEAISHLPVPPGWIARLRNATPEVRKGLVSIAGQRFTPKQWSLRRRRYCPGCIAEAPYHRTWWDILPIVDCPFHRVALKDDGPDGEILSFWWPHFDVSPNGAKLGVPAQRFDPGPTFETYVLGRLGFAESFSSPTYDPMDLSDAAHMCGALGYILSSRREKKVKRGKIPPRRWGEGFEESWKGLPQLVGSLMTWVEREVPEDLRRRGSSIVWERFSRRGREFWPESAKILRTAMFKAVTTLNSTERTCFSERDFEAGHLGIGALARKLGVHHNAVAKIACDLGLMPKRTFYRGRVHLTPGQAAQIESTISDTVSISEAKQILHVPAGCMGILRSSGLIRKLPGVRKDGALRLRTADVAAVMTTLDAIAPSEQGEAVSMRTYGRRHGLAMRKVIERILRGEIDGLTRFPGTKGFDGIRIPGESWRWKRWYSTIEEYETRKEVLRKPKRLTEKEVSDFSRL